MSLVQPSRSRVPATHALAQRTRRVMAAVLLATVGGLAHALLVGGS